MRELTGKGSGEGAPAARGARRSESKGGRDLLFRDSDSGVVPEGYISSVTMGDSDQPLSEYLAQPGGGGAVLPSKIQQALHDALVNALDVKSAQEVQGFGAEVFVGLYEATVDEEDYLPAYAKIIERWAGNAPPQKRPVLNSTDAKAAESKSKGAVDDDDDLASLRGGGPGGTETKFDLMNSDLAKMGFTTGMQGTAFDASLYAGRALEQSEVEGEAYGRDASATAVGVLCRKAKSGDTLTEVLDRKDVSALADLFMNLIREYNGMDCSAEAKVLTNFWVQTQETFGTDSKGLIEYMKAYRRKYRGRGLPEPLDVALVLMTTRAAFRLRSARRRWPTA